LVFLGVITVVVLIFLKLPFLVVLVIDFAIYSFLAVIGFVPLYTLLVILLLAILLFVINMMRGG
jgi:hypothetical protein